MSTIRLLGQPHNQAWHEAMANQPEVYYENPQPNAEDFVSAQNTPEQIHGYTRRVKIGGATVRYTYLEPENLLENIPILEQNGFGGPGTAYKTLAEHIAALGRPVAYLSPPRTQDFRHATDIRNILDVLRLQAQAGWGVMKDVSHVTGHDRFDLAPHSMGLTTAVKLAKHKPDHVRSIVSIGGAGLDGPNGCFKMALSGTEVAREEIFGELGAIFTHHNPHTLSIDTMHYLLRRPLRTLREGLAAATTDTRPGLLELKQRGVRIGALLFENDGFFDPAEVLEKTEGLFDYTRVIPGAIHIHPQIKPKEHALEQVQALSALNNTLRSV